MSQLTAEQITTLWHRVAVGQLRDELARAYDLGLKLDKPIRLIVDYDPFLGTTYTGVDVRDQSQWDTVKVVYVVLAFTGNSQEVDGADVVGVYRDKGQAEEVAKSAAGHGWWVDAVVREQKLR